MIRPAKDSTARQPSSSGGAAAALKWPLPPPKTNRQQKKSTTLKAPGISGCERRPVHGLIDDDTRII